MAQKQMFAMSIDSSIAMMERLFRNFEAANSGDEDRFVPILISRPGLGKSATIAKMAKRMGYSLIDLNLANLDPTDSLGLGAREKVDGVWETQVALPTWVKKAMAGNCVIFIDEFNMAGPDTLGSFQKLLSDFVIDGRKLPRTTHIIGACNPPGRDAIYAAKRLSGAFRRRLCMLPVVDDFEYVMAKHQFSMPRGFLKVDYTDMVNYCEYDEISSAVIDNIFNIFKYEGLTDLEKLTLISGFGGKAFDFAREMGLFSEDILTAGKRIGMVEEEDLAISYIEWKKNPGDQVSEFQQILWTQESLANSYSYTRSKKFVSRIRNPKVYSTAVEILRDKWEAEVETDETPLPSSRELS